MREKGKKRTPRRESKRLTQALPNRAPETQVSEKSANFITRHGTCYPPQPHQTGWFDEGYQGNLTPGFFLLELGNELDGLVDMNKVSENQNGFDASSLFHSRIKGMW